MTKKEECPVCETKQPTYELNGHIYIVRHDGPRGSTCQGSHREVLRSSAEGDRENIG